ncbi:MAG: TatD family hydrolase [Verrucomicrobiota bacterium]|nr:TatD family hydrolase [Verrucomicrobiota bacterium]
MARLVADRFWLVVFKFPISSIRFCNMFFDTHVHFDQWNAGAAEATARRALEAGVTKMIAVGGSIDANRRAVELAGRFPKNIRAAVGFDRGEAEPFSRDIHAWEAAIEHLGNLIRRKRAVIAAVGEIGLDFHYHPETARAQIRLFDAQLELARAARLPVVVHTREADKETLRSLKRHAKAWAGDTDRIGVAHCFTGDAATARRLLARRFHIGLSGIVTFANAGPVLAVAAMTPEDRLLIETDSPYLAPIPYRGKTNEPALVRRVAEKVAEIRGCAVARIAALTMRNGERLFGMTLI